MQGIDLHAHTTASDGTLTPTEVAELAVLTGLVAFAVTDHDTIDGLEEASAAAARLGIEFVPGIELAVTYPSGRFHMLGYLIDHQNPALSGRLQKLKDNRANRNHIMLRNIQALGIPLTLEEVEAVSGGGQIGRPHMALAMVQRGITATTQEAFDRYLADGAAAHVPKDKISFEEGLDLIHAAGGLASLAHPDSLKLDDSRLAEDLVRLKEAGLDGVECYYSQHNRARTDWLLQQAERCGLMVTGGSDFHGAPKPNVFLGRVLDGRPVPYEILDRMKARRPI